MSETSAAYAGGYASVAEARRTPVAQPVTVAADDAGMLVALLETRKRVLFARASEARLTRQLGATRAEALALEAQWDGAGNPPERWAVETVRLASVMARLAGDLLDAQERRQRLGDTQALDLGWAPDDEAQS